MRVNIVFNVVAKVNSSVRKVAYLSGRMGSATILARKSKDHLSVWTKSLGIY